MLIESALWEPLNIAQTGRKLGINSDARYRFERGVDPDFMVPGLELATQMVLELCGGTPSRDRGRRQGRSAGDRVIDFPPAEVKRLAGLDRAAASRCSACSTKLGFFVAGQDERVKVAAPSWRPDVEGKADLVEEVVRIVGVDRIPLDAVRPRRRAAQARADHRCRCARARPSARSRRAA